MTPWGKRRNVNGRDDPTGSITSQTTRGFTGEEELSLAGLVHLNGRVYDPLLARFTSADPNGFSFLGRFFKSMRSLAKHSV